MVSRKGHRVIERQIPLEPEAAPGAHVAALHGAVLELLTHAHITRAANSIAPNSHHK